MTLEQRIARLERQNRWMKRTSGVAVVLVGLFLTLGQSRGVPDTIEAQRFAIRDESGKPRGFFGTHKGEMLLMMTDSGEKSGASLKPGELTLFHTQEGGEKQVVAGMSSDEGLSAQNFIVVDEKGKPRGYFGVLEGVPKLSLQDRNNKTQTSLELGELYLFDDQGGALALSGKPSVQLSQGVAKGAGSIILSFQEGPSVHLTGKNGSASLSTSAKAGALLLLTSLSAVGQEDPGMSSLSAYKNSGGLLVSGKGGRVLIKAESEAVPWMRILDRDDKTQFKAP